MQPIFFALTITCDSNEDVAPHELRQDARTIHLFEQSSARIEFYVVEKCNPQEQPLNFFGFICEHFFGEVIEDVSFGLSQHIDQISLPVLQIYNRLLCYLANQL